MDSWSEHSALVCRAVQINSNRHKEQTHAERHNRKLKRAEPPFLKYAATYLFCGLHSEMKFEQLLKIICKRYFLLYFIIPLLHPPVPLFVGREGSDGRGHNVNRHTELL